MFFSMNENRGRSDLPRKDAGATVDRRSQSVEGSRGRREWGVLEDGRGLDGDPVAELA